MHACLHGMNGELQQFGDELLMHEAEDGVDGKATVPLLATRQLGGGTPRTSALAVYCPFCGERLRDPRRGD